MKSVLKLFVLSCVFACGSYQSVNNTTKENKTKDGYWQQHVDYKMTIDMDVDSYQYHGSQELIYTNNSPDQLDKVFYHLFFNAFQPGSEMDVRSRTIEDPDRRVKDRISKLKPNEIGFIKVNSLKQNGVAVKYHVAGTILEVELNSPLQPGDKVVFNMDFDGQVPVQIRRSGRNNAEGVALSMTQWYPKLAEYDFEGWHADPYIGREFHGVWGDFDVTINIDKSFVVGGTGYLQNPNEIGHGYENSTLKLPKGDKLSWHFIAPKVHDFTWAADPEYIHDIYPMENGPTLHFLYKDNPDIKDNWKKLQPKTADLMRFFSNEIGEYPYDQYSVIQGGDGGMEYAMCTLITGERKFGSLVGVTAHELAHTWFQFLLATNESKHEWMDEGFTSYISDQAMNVIMDQNKENPYSGAYRGYYYLVNSGKEQPQSTHADRYHLNMAYSIAAYSKGEVFLAQLGYIIGEAQLKKTLQKYFQDFAFKHPRPIDIIRSAEKISGLELDWYLTDWTQTTNTIDYKVERIDANSNSSSMIHLKRVGAMPMPINLEIELTDGTKKAFYIPLQMMRGERPLNENEILLKDWAWAYLIMNFQFLLIKKELKKCLLTLKIKWQTLIKQTTNFNYKMLNLFNKPL